MIWRIVLLWMLCGEPALASLARHLGYAYDPSRILMVSRTSLPNLAFTTNHYDSLGRLDSTALVNFWGHTLDGAAYEYAIPDLRTKITRDLGLTTNTVDLAYDDIGQLTKWAGKETGGAPRLNEKLSYGYDAAGNLQYRTNNALVQTFSVNNLNELSTVGRTGTLTVSGALPAPATNVTVNGSAAERYSDLTFAKDGFTLSSGNNTFGIIASNVYGVRATNNFTVNLPVTVTFQYDSNGNLTNDGTRSFVYDAENQLTNVFVAGSWKTEFVYDGFGRRRISKDYAWQGTNWIKTNETRYLCDGLVAIQERDINNAVQVTYTRGLDLSGSLASAGGIGGLLARTDATNASAFYHSDGAGNVTSLIDSRQNIVARYLYDPFGRALSQSGPLASLNSMGFSSMTMHRASGMVAYPYRFYDAGLGRWLNADPIGEAGGVNLYGFVGNSPYYAIDPLGLSWDDWFDWQSSKEYFWGLTGKFTDKLIEDVRSVENMVRPELKSLNNLLFDRALQTHNYLNDRIYGIDPNCPPDSDWSHRGGYAGITLAVIAELLTGGEEGNAAKSIEQGRNALGRFVAKAGGELPPGSLAEKAVWDAIRKKAGWRVIEGRVSVRNAAGDPRVYDGAAVSPRGRVIGLEVKSGGSPYRGSQSAFDAGVNTFNPAIGVGQNSGLQVGRSILIRVP